MGNCLSLISVFPAYGGHVGNAFSCRKWLPAVIHVEGAANESLRAFLHLYCDLILTWAVGSGTTGKGVTFIPVKSHLTRNSFFFRPFWLDQSNEPHSC